MEPKEIAQTLGHQLEIKSLKKRDPQMKPSASTPVKHTIDPQERLQFLKEMETARQDMAELRKNMNRLTEQMDTISIDLENSKDRVFEIEQDLTIIEEVNVNLQVLVEKSLEKQRESDIYTTQTIRNMYPELTTVVYENNQLQGRLSKLEKHQKKQEINVKDATMRIYEYRQMIEQAQGTIHLLHKSSDSSRRTSSTSWTDDEGSVMTKRETQTHVPSIVPKLDDMSEPLK